LAALACQIGFPVKQSPRDPLQPRELIEMLPQGQTGMKCVSVDRMNSDEQRLLRHLGLVLAVKLAALAMLWWLFFSGTHGPVQAPSAPMTANAAASPRGEQP